MKATKDDIGKKLYPVDNSYSQDLSTGKYATPNNNAGLAGAVWTPAVKCTIESEPYIITVPAAAGNLVTREMVIVSYGGKKYLMLNNFEFSNPRL